MFNLGTTELLIILAIIIFLFGGRKIPELTRGLGLSVRNFKKGLHEPEAIDVTPQKREDPEKNSPASKKP